MTTNSSKAYLCLIKIISGRDYSEFKLREKLHEKKYSKAEIDEAINEIKSKGFLREEIYAGTRIKSYMEKAYSPDYIRQKLALEHLIVTDEEIQAIYLEYGLTTEDQIERLIRKKLRTKTEFDFSEENKILRYLISKGHDFNNSRKLIKSLVQNNIVK